MKTTKTLAALDKIRASYTANADPCCAIARARTLEHLAAAIPLVAALGRRSVDVRLEGVNDRAAFFFIGNARLTVNSGGAVWYRIGTAGVGGGQAERGTTTLGALVTRIVAWME